MGVPYLGVLIIRILLFRVLPLGSPIFGNSQVAPSRQAEAPTPVNVCRVWAGGGSLSVLRFFIVVD